MAETALIDTSLVQRAMRRGHKSLAVGAIAGDDQAIAGFGRARGDASEPPSGETIFEIGSITKVFTGLLLAEMATEGVLGLDDPLDLHLPAGVAPPLRDRAITLAELASHSAGLPRDPRGTLAAVLRRPRHPFLALLDAYAALTLEELHASLSRTKARPPGRRARYSNLGVGLLGNVLASRAGSSYQDAVRRRICLPLGMNDTYVEVPDELGARLAQGHRRRGRPRSPFEHPALVGAGSLRSTAEDMLRLLRAHVDPPAGRLGIAIERAQRPRGRLGRKTETGLGWMIASPGRPSVQTHWHNGGTGGFRSFAAFVREQRAAVVVLANTSRSVDLLGLRLLKALSARRE